MSTLNPNAPMTRLRRWVASKITVRPRAGKAWCLDCVMNGNRTLIIDADDAMSHTEAHKDCSSPVKVEITWPGTR